jgi:hypothetical protein
MSILENIKSPYELLKQLGVATPEKSVLHLRYKKYFRIIDEFAESGSKDAKLLLGDLSEIGGDRLTEFEESDIEIVKKFFQF